MAPEERHLTVGEVVTAIGPIWPAGDWNWIADRLGAATPLRRSSVRVLRDLLDGNGHYIGIDGMFLNGLVELVEDVARAAREDAAAEAMREFGRGHGPDSGGATHSPANTDESS